MGIIPSIIIAGAVEKDDLIAALNGTLVDSSVAISGLNAAQHQDIR